MSGKRKTKFLKISRFISMTRRIKEEKIKVPKPVLPLYQTKWKRLIYIQKHHRYKNV